METIASLVPRDIIKTEEIIRDGIVIKESRSFTVISNPIIQQNTESCICVAITSSEDTRPFLIPMRLRDVEGEISEEQQIDCSKIYTFFKKQIKEKTGLKITPDMHSQIMTKIHEETIPK